MIRISVKSTLFRKTSLLALCLICFGGIYEKIIQDRAEKVLVLDPNISLSRDELVRAFTFIEKHSRDKKKKFLPQESRVPCTIERSSLLNGYILSNFKNDFVGFGAHKHIKKVVLYGNQPKVLAECHADRSGQAETKILKLLQGKPGIVPYYGTFAKSKKRFTIYLEYFPEGSILDKLKQGYSFSEQEILHIAHDLVNGLRSIHDLKLVHRDLHFGNCLLRRNADGMFEAVFVDFGKTQPFNRLNGVFPQVPKSKNPPEILTTPLYLINRYQADIYALGCLFFHLVWGKSTPWGYLYNYKLMSTFSVEKKKRLYAKIVSFYALTKKEKINHLLKKDERTSFDKFKIIIFNMLHYQPNQRPTLDSIDTFLQGF